MLGSANDGYKAAVASGCVYPKPPTVPTPTPKPTPTPTPTPTPKPIPTPTPIKPTPTPTPTPPVTYHPTQLLDFQTGNFSQWQEQQYFRAAQEAIVTSPARSGYPYTASFTVTHGDMTSGDTGRNRAEVMASFAASGNPSQGKTVWYAWSTFIPSGFNVDSDAASPVGNGWLIFTQWHGTSDYCCGPNIAFALTKGTATPHIILDTNGGSGSGVSSEWVQPTAVPLGKWNDFMVGITWGESSSVGRMTVRINGTTWLNNAPSSNLFTGESSYMKQGIYRATSNQTQTIYDTGTRVGPTEASVTR
jgi:hypothetical protein